MKKKNIALATITSLLLVGGCANIASSDLTSKKQDSNDVDAESKVITKLDDLDDVYGLSTLTSVSLLAQNEESATLTNQDANMINLAWNDVSEEEIEKINNYIGMFEVLLADEGVLSSNIEDSDIEAYDYMMTIKVKNFLNEVTTYLMYFNEIVVEVNEKLVLDDDEEDIETSENVDEILENQSRKMNEVRQFDRLKDKIDELSTRVEGIMVVGENTYDVVGTKIVHQSYIRTSFISMIDRRNYVVVTNTTNEDKGTFNYRVVMDGRIASRSVVEIKDVENKTEVRFRLIEDKELTEYRFSKIIEENKEIIRIRIIEDMNVIDIKVFIETNEETGEVSYRYRFFDGKEFFKSRNERLKKVKEDLEEIKNRIKEKLEERIPNRKN